MKKLLSILLLVTSSQAMADLNSDFDSLGGNDVLLDRAQKLNPDASISVVQDRLVPRRARLEFAPEFSTVLGGDSYVNTRSVGGNLYFHFVPKFAIGVKYAHHMNELKPEGERRMKESIKERNEDDNVREGFPDIDHPKSTIMGMLNFYPFYGKLNLFDLGIVHFDIYALGGYGVIDLKNGSRNTYTAGGGVGFWFTQHLTSRLEMRYQNYVARRWDGDVTMHTTVASFQMGWML